ncbi:hypothetical protein MtrunA17_Chr7g0214581 [Medicago truncatula]|uniref:Uncharacterized protein n=1 Tax=Medicago truncatula TaxID=3880 RepID=A0A396GS66_MEDTR|nr:hypothetical protein MtrunA17_Chr7g0214581 [Medicago truncatula]
MTSQQNSSAPTFDQLSPSFSNSSGPFSEPTGQLTPRQGFSCATNQPAQTLPSGQFSQPGFSASNPSFFQPLPVHMHNNPFLLILVNLSCLGFRHLLAILCSHLFLLKVVNLLHKQVIIPTMDCTPWIHLNHKMDITDL